MESGANLPSGRKENEGVEYLGNELKEQEKGRGQSRTAANN